MWNEKAYSMEIKQFDESNTFQVKWKSSLFTKKIKNFKNDF